MKASILGRSNQGLLALIHHAPDFLECNHIVLIQIMLDEVRQSLVLKISLICIHRWRSQIQVVSEETDWFFVMFCRLTWPLNSLVISHFVDYVINREPPFHI